MGGGRAGVKVEAQDLHRVGRLQAFPLGVQEEGRCFVRQCIGDAELVSFLGIHHHASLRGLCNNPPEHVLCDQIMLFFHRPATGASNLPSVSHVDLACYEAIVNILELAS